MHQENMQICQELVFNKKNLELLTHASLILPSHAQTITFLYTISTLHPSHWILKQHSCAISIVSWTWEFLPLQIVGINELGTFLGIQKWFLSLFSSPQTQLDPFTLFLSSCLWSSQSSQSFKNASGIYGTRLFCLPALNGRLPSPWMHSRCFLALPQQDFL
jgi:hypothetical protein